MQGRTSTRRGAASLGVVLALLLSACASQQPAPPTTQAPAPTVGSTAAATPPPTAAPTTTTTPSPTTTTFESKMATCMEGLEPGHTPLPCGGFVYDLAIPDACFSESCGLIVDFRPNVLTGDETDVETNMRALGNAAGFVVVQPNSTSGRDAAYRDRIFFDALIVALDIDANRVHVGGGSTGGFQTWHFICDHADLIASAAPHASGRSNAPNESCDFTKDRSPAEQVDILISHSRYDNRVRFERGTDQLDLVAQSWDLAVDQVLIEEDDYTWTRWTNDIGTVVEFLEFDWTKPNGYGHCYPGGVGPAGCSPDNPVHYGEAALAFYLAHPKNEASAAVETGEASAEIIISGFSFGEPITVAVGDTVTIRNDDSSAHTWTSDSDLFDSGSLAKGEEFTFTFEEPGEYSFYCEPHRSMVGTITVTG